MGSVGGVGWDMSFRLSARGTVSSQEWFSAMLRDAAAGMSCSPSDFSLRPSPALRVAILVCRHATAIRLIRAYRASIALSPGAATAEAFSHATPCPTRQLQLRRSLDLLLLLTRLSPVCCFPLAHSSDFSHTACRRTTAQCKARNRQNGRTVRQPPKPVSLPGKDYCIHYCPTHQ